MKTGDKHIIGETADWNEVAIGLYFLEEVTLENFLKKLKLSCAEINVCKRGIMAVKLLVFVCKGVFHLSF